MHNKKVILMSHFLFKTETIQRQRKPWVWLGDWSKHKRVSPVCFYKGPKQVWSSPGRWLNQVWRRQRVNPAARRSRNWEEDFWEWISSAGQKWNWICRLDIPRVTCTRWGDRPHAPSPLCPTTAESSTGISRPAHPAETLFSGFQSGRRAPGVPSAQTPGSVSWLLVVATPGLPLQPGEMPSFLHLASLALSPFLFEAKRLYGWTHHRYSLDSL